MKLWAGRPKDASGNKVAPVEIPVEPVVPPVGDPRRGTPGAALPAADPRLMGTAYKPQKRTPKAK